MATATQIRQSAIDIYALIKGLELENFPLPTPHQAVNVGTFDGRTGEFRLASGVSRQTEVTGRGPHGQTLFGTYFLARANAVKVALRFSVANRQGDFHVAVNDAVFSAAAGQNTLDVEIDTQNQVDFSVQSGARDFGGRLVIDRSKIVGVGAFTVPAFPIAVVYAPTQGKSLNNQVDYTQVVSVGTDTTISFNFQQSTATSNFDSIGALRQKASDILNAFQLAGGEHPYAAAAAIGLTLVANALGSVDDTTTQGTSVTNAHRLAVRDTTVFRAGPEAHQGPGSGDRIIFFRDAKVVWLSDNGNLTLALLPPREQAGFAVRELQSDLQNLASDDQSGTITGLNRQTIESLLRLDPFVSPTFQPVSHPRLPTPRFTVVGSPFIFGGSGTGDDGDGITWIHEVSADDVRVEESFTIHTEDHRPGFLSFLGIGEQDNVTFETTFTNSSSVDRTVDQQVSVTLTFFTEGDETYRVAGYYDRVFGTVAFVNPLAGPETA